MNGERADHDKYGKELLASVLGERWVTWLEDARFVDMAGVRAGLDGIIRSSDRSKVECAVEVEAKNYKQIRGSILDLAWHPAPKKLLVVIRAQKELKDENQVRRHCGYVWEKLASNRCGNFKLVVLKGTGAQPLPEIGRPRVTVPPCLRGRFCLDLA